MKLKKLMLLILLISLPMQMIFSNQSNNNKENLGNELGIDLTRTYSGSEVEELINIIFEEAEESIKQSYQEGYKQGVLEYKPQIEYWKSLYESSRKTNLEKLFTYTVVGFGAGILTGAGITLAFKINF